MGISGRGVAGKGMFDEDERKPEGEQSRWA
jgi:hypothetical protein